MAPIELSAEAIGDPAESDEESVSPLSGKDILVVDDCADIILLVKMILQNHGASVRDASNALDGLEQVHLKPPDAILCDISMPEIDGYSFLQRLQPFLVAQGLSIPVVALTALAAEDDRKKILAAGFKMHITKPFNANVLVNSLVDLLYSHYRLGV